MDNYQTIEGIKKHPSYRELSPKSQVFVITYLESNGDKTAAAKKAFGTAKSWASLTSRCIKEPNVRALINAFNGTEAIDDPNVVGKTELKELISRRLRKAESDSTFCSLLNHYEKLTERVYGATNRAQQAAKIDPKLDNLDRLVQKIEADRSN